MEESTAMGTSVSKFVQHWHGLSCAHLVWDVSLIITDTCAKNGPAHCFSFTQAGAGQGEVTFLAFSNVFAALGKDNWIVPCLNHSRVQQLTRDNSRLWTGTAGQFCGLVWTGSTSLRQTFLNHASGIRLTGYPVSPGSPRSPLSPTGPYESTTKTWGGCKQAAICNISMACACE